MWEICSTKPVIAERGEDPRVLRSNWVSCLGDVQSRVLVCTVTSAREIKVA